MQATDLCSVLLVLHLSVHYYYLFYDHETVDVQDCGRAFLHLGFVSFHNKPNLLLDKLYMVFLLKVQLADKSQRQPLPRE